MPRLSSLFSPAFLLAMTLLLLLPAMAPAQDAPGQFEPYVEAYNEACRLALAGRLEEAVAALGRARELGFDDVDFALADPDLAPLRDLTAFRDLVVAGRATLQLESASLALDLIQDQWSQPLVLQANQGQAGELRLRWQALGLDFEFTGRGEWSSLGQGKLPAPWNGGPALVLTLAVPDASAPYASTTNHVTAYGLEKSTPVGGLHHPTTGWQRVLELDPELERDQSAGTLTIRGTIPWQTIRPFHPLVDTRLGFNAALRVLDAASGNLRRAVVFADPAAFRTDRPLRRFLPLNFTVTSARREEMVGKLDTARNQGDTVELTLGMVAENPGRGVLEVDFSDNKQASVVPGGPLSLPLELDAGFNRWQQQIDVSGLKPGLYTARISLEYPSGRTAVWSSRILQLGSSWRDTTLGRVAALADWARPTGEHYLETISAALDRQHPRLDPGPVATTVHQLEGMLQSAENLGTILPASGQLAVAYPGPEGQRRLADIYLPAEWQTRGPLNPVLVLGEARLLTGRLTTRLARSYTHEGHLDAARKTTTYSPVYVVPRFPVLRGAIQEQALAEVRALRRWVASAFAADRMSLCGVDLFGGAALSLIREESAAIAGALIMAGRNLAPWPQASDEFIDRQLGPGVPGVPISWYDFSQETRHNQQANQLVASLRRLGYDVGRVNRLKGGLNHTQIADRVVLWAESLR
jgi:hypothetical protein